MFILSTFRNLMGIVLLLSALSLQAASVTPTVKDIRYGPFSKNTFDLYMPPQVANPPLAIFIHGGGFKSGDKAQVQDGDVLDQLLEAGIAVASANYRSVISDDVTIDTILQEDMTLLVQTLRYRSAAFGFNPNKFAAYGNSAGAGAALWLGVHNDVADPLHRDPVRQQSSKVQIVGHLAGQATYDTNQWSSIAQVNPVWPLQIDFEDDLDWFGVNTRSELYTPEVNARKQSIDLIGLMSADDAYLYLENYSRDTQIILNNFLTDEEKKDAKTKIAHSPNHAILLHRQCITKGLVCEIYTFETGGPVKGDMLEFFKQYLL